MTFLQQTILWGLPLVLLPIIIHFIHRLRHKPVKWAAMMFILMAQKSSTKFAKLRQWIILACRMAALLFLVLALARPLTGGWLGMTLSGSPETIILVVDRSSSMALLNPLSNKSKLQESLDMFANAMATFSEKPRLVIIDNIRKNPLELNSNEMLRDPKVLPATSTTANLPSMLQKAVSYIQENQTGLTEVWIASDLQANNWQLKQNAWKSIISDFSNLPQKVRLRLLGMNAIAKNNQSITIDETKSYLINGKHHIDIAYSIRRSEISLATIPITIKYGDKEKHLELTPKGNKITAHHTIILDKKHPAGWGSITIPNDKNPLDNQAFFAFGSPQLITAAVVSDDQEFAKQVALSISPAPKLLQQECQCFRPLNFSKITLSSTSLLVWNAPFPTGKDGENLQQFVENGGVLVVIPTKKQGPNQDNLLFDKYKYEQPEIADESKNFQVSYWQQDSGPLAKTAEGHSLPLGRIQCLKRCKVTGMVQSLAQFKDGGYLFSRTMIGRGQILFFHTIPFSEWSTLGQDGLVMVPLFQRLLTFGGQQYSDVQQFICGTIDPEKKLKPCFENKLRTPYHSTAGVYQYNDNWYYLLKRPPSEDDYEPLNKGELNEHFSSLDFTLFEKENLKNKSLQSELWDKLLILIFIALIIAGILTLNHKKEKKKREVTS